MPKRKEKSRPKPHKVRYSLAVYVDKQRIVFGNYDDPAAWQKYSDFCEQRQNGGNETSAASVPSNLGGCSPGVTVPNTTGNPALIADLVTQFLEAAQKAKNPSDYGNYKIAGQALWRYKELPTADFDAYLLLQIQNGFVNAGYARRQCNRLTNFIVHIFKWGEVRRLVTPGKSVQLKAVEPVRAGTAKDNEERMPVDDDVVERTLPFLLPIYQAFIRILRSTGARPSEICRMKVSDIDRTDPKTWVFRIRHHKTMRYNKRRVLAFGRKDQAVLAPYLEGKAPNAAVFSPKDAVRERKERDRSARKTPFTPSQLERDKNRKRHPKAKNNEHFDTHTVGIALRVSILKANRKLPPDQQIPHWTLYQLRHAFLTEKTEQFDENVAALLAGHSDPKMVREIYDKSQERRIIKLKQMEDEQEQDGEREAS